MAYPIHTDPDLYADRLALAEARAQFSAIETFSAKLSGEPHLAIEKFNNATAISRSPNVRLFANKPVQSSQVNNAPSPEFTR